MFCAVSCSCDVATGSGDVIQSVCTGPSEAPCIMCGSDRCQVGYNPHCVVLYNNMIQVVK